MLQVTEGVIKGEKKKKDNTTLAYTEDKANRRMEEASSYFYHQNSPRLKFFQNIWEEVNHAFG